MLLRPFVFSIRWRRRRAIGGRQMDSGRIAPRPRSDLAWLLIGSRLVFDRFLDRSFDQDCFFDQLISAGSVQWPIALFSLAAGRLGRQPNQPTIKYPHHSPLRQGTGLAALGGVHQSQHRRHLGIGGRSGGLLG